MGLMRERRGQAERIGTGKVMPGAEGGKAEGDSSAEVRGTMRKAR